MKGRVLFAIAIGALAGCDAILGIGDVPAQDVVDSATPDASKDTGFDFEAGPPDGCVGSGYACTAAAPAGWSGPVAFAAAAGGTIPACSGAYGGAGASGHDGLDAGAASCTCTCPSQATGTTCPNPTLTVFSGNSCNTPAQTISLTPSICSDFSSSAGSINAEAGAPSSLGTCTPSSTQNIPPATWSDSFAVCNYLGLLDGGGCGTDVCVLMPSSAYDPKPCVTQTGDVACPGAPYTKKTVFTTTLDDARKCSSCACKAAGGACAANVTGWTSPGCTGTSTTFSADLSCAGQGANVSSAVSTTPSVTAASCTPDGGNAIGIATPSGSVTVCCQP